MRLLRQAQARLPRLRLRYERRVMTLLLLILALDYADRTLIGALGPTLEQVYHISQAQLGYLSSAFLLVGVGAVVPLGVLTDRVRRMRLLAWCLVIWSVMEGVTGAALSFAMLFGARVFLGIVSAATGPTTPSLTGDLVPGRARARALGFIDSGQLVGDGIGYLLPVVVLAFASFRWTFWFLGFCGILLIIACWRVREPERTGAAGPGGAANSDTEGEPSEPGKAQQVVQEQDIQPSQTALLHDDPRELSLWEAARYTFRVRTNLIVQIARSIGDFFFMGISTFAIVFATGWYGISQSLADVAILVVGLGALAGVLLVGRLADRFLRRGRLNSRLWLGALGYLLAPVALAPAFLTRTLALALPLFALGAFFLGGAGPPLDAVRLDVLVPLLRGRAEAVRQAMRAAAEGGAPALIGFLSSVLAGGGTAGLELALLVVLPLLIVNSLILLLALRTYQPDIAAALASAKQDERAP